MTKQQGVHYLNVVSPALLMIVRVPWPMPKWRLVLQALTVVMRSHGFMKKDISSIEGMTNSPDAKKEEIELPAERFYREETERMLPKLRAAFDGSNDLKAFWLYDWVDGSFALARPPVAVQ